MTFMLVVFLRTRGRLVYIDPLQSQSYVSLFDEVWRGKSIDHYKSVKSVTTPRMAPIGGLDTNEQQRCADIGLEQIQDRYKATTRCSWPIFRLMSNFYLYLLFGILASFFCYVVYVFPLRGDDPSGKNQI